VVGKFSPLGHWCFSPLATDFITSDLQIGNPVGNVDSAGVMGSYIGHSIARHDLQRLWVIASSLTSIKLFLLFWQLLCFLIYMGFDSLSALLEMQLFIAVRNHLSYESLSKGLVDSRDVIYFLSVTGFIY
jgi:ABC-2 type transport system permease protein